MDKESGLQAAESLHTVEVVEDAGLLKVITVLLHGHTTYHWLNVSRLTESAVYTRLHLAGDRVRRST